MHGNSESAKSQAGQAAMQKQASEGKFIYDLLMRMTLEEKLGQLSQYAGVSAITGPEVATIEESQIAAGRVGSFINTAGAVETLRLQRLAVEKSRLGIPLLFGYDVIHGFRTVLPVPLAESCSWNPNMAEMSARIAAREAAAAGLHWTFAPMVDIARDARWGRIVEGAGEDVFLGCVFAEARVRGFQGADLRSPESVMACAKHFAAYGAAEAGRDYNTVDVSPRTLHEVYMPSFKAAVDAGAGSIMAAFNEISGVPCTCNRHLFTDVLRWQWRFDGLVVSDFAAVRELMPHGVAATRADAGILALEAGIDMDMADGVYMRDLPGAARQGRLSPGALDEAVRRVLRAKYRLGLFSDPWRQVSIDRERRTLLAGEHREAARAVARESIVLLKNDGRLLPLPKSAGTLAVIGPLADNPAAVLGPWPGAGRPEEAVSLLEGIRNAVSKDTRVHYTMGCNANDNDCSGFDEAVRLAGGADCIILVLGEDNTMSGEAASRANIDLPGVQNDLAKAVLATNKPVVVVLVNGRPLAIEWLASHAPALLEAWQGGTEAGNAAADVLFGDYNPGGKLTVTFPRVAGQAPIYYNHKRTGRPPDDKIHYTSKYIDVSWTPLFPFGHGLGYTTFGYGGARLERDVIGATESIRVSVDVTNTGARTGEEVVQLYMQDEVASITRPVKELRGFEKIRLEPGERRTVSFELTPSDLAFYNMDMERVVEAGWFTIFIGTSSADTVEARFRVVDSYKLRA